MSYGLSLEIPLTPVAAVRPKVTKWNTYYPGAYGKYLPEARQWLNDYWSDDPLLSPLRVRLTFTLTRPKSHFRTGRNSHLVKNGAAGYPHQDVDNFIKGALDVLNGVVYKDDSQVVEVWAVKEYGDQARTFVEIETLATG